MEEPRPHQEASDGRQTGPLQAYAQEGSRETHEVGKLLGRPALVDLVQCEPQSLRFTRWKLGAHLTKHPRRHASLSRLVDASQQSPGLIFTAQQNQAPETEASHIEESSRILLGTGQKNESHARKVPPQPQKPLQPTRTLSHGRQIDQAYAHRPLPKRQRKPAERTGLGDVVYRREGISEAGLDPWIPGERACERHDLRKKYTRGRK